MEEPKLYPLWKEAVSEFIREGLDAPGTILSEDWKMMHFGLALPTSAKYEDVQKFQLKMLSAFESFRETLLQTHQVHLKSIGGGAHIVLAPHEQTSNAWNTGITDIARTMRQMRTRLTHVQIESLTNTERKENTDALVRMSMMAGMVKQVRLLEIE